MRSLFRTAWIITAPTIGTGLIASQIHSLWLGIGLGLIVGVFSGSLASILNSQEASQ